MTATALTIGAHVDLKRWLSQVWSPANAHKEQPASVKPPAAGAEPAAPSPPPPDAPFSLVEAVGKTYPPEARVYPAAASLEVGGLAALARQRVLEGRIELPSFPPLAAQIFSTIEHPEFDMNELAALVRRDPVIAAQVLKVANSLRFAGAQHVENIREAVVRLGAKETAQAVSAVSVQALFDLEARVRAEHYKDLAHQLWLHSLVAAYSASWAATMFDRGDPDRAFLGGLLHDVGKSVALRALAAVSMERPERIEGPVVFAVLEALHVELALHVSSDWKLSDGVRDIIRDHHDAAVPADDNLKLVRLTSALSELHSNPGHREGLEDEVDRASRELRLTDSQLKALGSELPRYAKRAGAMG